MIINSDLCAMTVPCTNSVHVMHTVHIHVHSRVDVHVDVTIGWCFGPQPNTSKGNKVTIRSLVGGGGAGRGSEWVCRSVCRKSMGGDFRLSQLRASWLSANCVKALFGG